MLKHPCDDYANVLTATVERARPHLESQIERSRTVNLPKLNALITIKYVIPV